MSFENPIIFFLTKKRVQEFLNFKINLMESKKLHYFYKFFNNSIKLWNFNKFLSPAQNSWKYHKFLPTEQIWRKFDKFFSPHKIEKIFANFVPHNFEKLLQVFSPAQIEKIFTSFCPSGKSERQSFSTSKMYRTIRHRGGGSPPVTKPYARLVTGGTSSRDNTCILVYYSYFSQTEVQK